MAEQLKSITEARQNLPNLSQDAHQKMDRYVITNQGKPQSVLLGYLDYQKMKAAVELLHRPEALASIRRGLSDLQSGRRFTAEDLKQRLRQRETARENQAAEALFSGRGLETQEVSETPEEALLRQIFGQPAEQPGDFSQAQSAEPMQREEGA